MKKLVVITLLALTFSITACGSAKESVKTEQSAESKKVEKSESKKDSKIVAKADSKTEESVEDNAEVQETESGKSDEVEEVVTNAKSESSASGKQKTTSEKNSTQTAGTQTQSTTTNTTPSQSTATSTSPAPAAGTTPSTTSTPSNTQSDDSLPDDEIDPAPEQPRAQTLEDALAACGVTNYKIINNGNDFIDYDGYTIMIDGVGHNIWKGVDYGTSSPYGLWGGGCASFGNCVPEGWNPSWTVAQVDAALGF